MQWYELQEGESWNDSNMPEDNRKIKFSYMATPGYHTVTNSDDIGSEIWRHVKYWEYADEKNKTEQAKKALDTQQGGNHYKDLAIQPVEYIFHNRLEYLEGNVVKYVTRHRNKNGAEDIRKAIHYCQLILELQYAEKTTP